MKKVQWHIKDLIDLEYLLQRDEVEPSRVADGASLSVHDHSNTDEAAGAQTAGGGRSDEQIAKMELRVDHSHLQTTAQEADGAVSCRIEIQVPAGQEIRQIDRDIRSQRRKLEKILIITIDLCIHSRLKISWLGKSQMIYITAYSQILNLFA